MLNNQIIQSPKKTIVFFFAVSCCWHLMLFSAVSITFPHLRAPSKKEVNFLGSFLNNYDITSAGFKQGQKAQGHGYVKLAADNIMNETVAGFEKIDVVFEKPKYYASFYTREIDEVVLLYAWQNPVLLKKGGQGSAAEFDDFIDASTVSTLQTYFKEGVPCPVKFELDISGNGRIRSLNKEITSGSFDVDLMVQRYLQKLMFDYSKLGIRHKRNLQLFFTP
jgi:hypothetical protein